MKKFNGFTLVELMIAVAIMSILLAVAAPNFRNIIQNNRLTTNANEMISAFMVARSEAIKRGVSVQVMSLGGNNWANGWAIVTDEDNDAIFNPMPACGANQDCQIQNKEALDPSLSFRSPANNAQFFEFDARGRLRVANSPPNTLVMCDERNLVPAARAIVISNTGRVRVLSATDPAANAPNC